ncbi:capsular polysaccharide transport system permease protein [Methylobacterium sp. OAE515]|uniref:ABC transporter permease n=1 Tax=Methylobacterium sp. OAE515 TaxID=2817895 RepID=UPI00178BEDE6
MSTLPSTAALKSPGESYLHVLHALMLRDMRTRFGASLWGYGVVVLWPCVHVFMLIAIYSFQKIPSPLGDSRAIFFASGAVPVLVFQYISREVMKAVISNRPLTYYPQVKLFDVIFARILVEIVTGFLALIVVFTVLLCMGENPVPANPYEAMCAYASAILLGIGIGTINVAIIGFFPGWLLGYALLSIVLYISSGVIFMPSFLPDNIYMWLKYNPVLQLAEWMRSAYYPYSGLDIDRMYIILFALSAISIGLYLVKTVVAKMTA